MDFAAARRSMIENQLRTSQIIDRAVLDVMGRLPRECFVPEDLAGIAYVDEDLPLGGGRYLMEPLALARMIQAAVVREDNTVLLVGAGAGYEAAVVAGIARAVVAVESDKNFVDRAAANLAANDVHGVEIVHKPLAEGFPEKAPYDCILMAGAVAAVPATLTEQLAEGGRLVAVVRDAKERFGKGTVFARIRGSVVARVAFDSAVPWLPGFEPQPGFVF